ncbi:MAG: nucleotidyl transferase AbiEii/AbiGii toxin family protein [Gammaproteobacteria bacterium]|nr:nucleotidyl transferase AbiEii/AbiGii toxin family protein [Gammaproteobacteria bacterium]
MAKCRSNGGRQDPPAPLVQALGAVSEWLESAAVPGAIIGGVAASVLGRPRLTEDIDVLVILERQEWTPFLRAGREFGFAPRVDDALDFAESSRVLLVVHQPSGISIDIVLGALPLEDEIVRGARNVEIAGVRLPLAAPESIVVMKTLARRARDIADIEGILEVHDELDLEWIRIRLTEFDQALGETELLDEFNRILALTRRTTAPDNSFE